VAAGKREHAFSHGPWTHRAVQTIGDLGNLGDTDTSTASCPKQAISEAWVEETEEGIVIQPATTLHAVPCKAELRVWVVGG
jgi:hypothetical protein